MMPHETYVTDVDLTVLDVILSKLSSQMVNDSQTWFPHLIDEDGDGCMREHYALGLAAEAGEVADVIKKMSYGKHRPLGDDLASEMADVLTYLLLLAHDQNVDIIGAYKLKRQHNMDRWSEKTPRRPRLSRWTHNAVAHPLLVIWPRAGRWLHERTDP